MAKRNVIKLGAVVADAHEPAIRHHDIGDIEEPQPAPMADERETAQWYMANGISVDDARKLLAAEVPDAEKRCYQFGGLLNWSRLPFEAKNALRRKLAQVRADSAKYEREVLGRDPNTGETKDEKEARIAAAFGIKHEPETIDITPAALTHPETAAAVTKALKEFEDATANVANAAEEYVRDYDAGAGFGAWKDLREAIKDRRAKHEAFLRAMVARPPQADEGANNTTKTGPDGLLPALS